MKVAVVNHVATDSFIPYFIVGVSMQPFMVKFSMLPNINGSKTYCLKVEHILNCKGL